MSSVFGKHIGKLLHQLSVRSEALELLDILYSKMVKSSLGVIILSTLLDPSASAPLYLPFVSVSQSDPRWLALNLDERTHLRQQH